MPFATAEKNILTMVVITTSYDQLVKVMFSSSWENSHMKSWSTRRAGNSPTTRNIKRYDYERQSSDVEYIPEESIFTIQYE